jgi:hypothetical protein
LTPHFARQIAGSHETYATFLHARTLFAGFSILRGPNMSKTTTNKPTAKTPDPADAKTLVVLGLDESDTPKAARFTGANRALVLKAAEAMKLNVVEVPAGDQAEVVKKLPLGRLYSSGKGFIGSVKESVYLKLTDALGLAVTGQKPEPAPLPRTWAEIGEGSLVIAPDKENGGYWEAIVVERSGDGILTLRFRDFPKQPKITCHVATVALLNAETAQ